MYRCLKCGEIALTHLVSACAVGAYRQHKWEDYTVEDSIKEDRKQYPLATGLMDYFPDALMAVAGASFVGARQHNDGRMGWDRSKSTDDADAALRHFMERGKIDTDGVPHMAKAAWRFLAILQKEMEKK